MFPTEPFLVSGSTHLRHITAHDYASLKKVALDQRIWTYFVYDVNDDPSLKNYIHDVLHQKDLLARYSFAIIDDTTGQVVGSSAFGNYVPHDRRIEIGWSWVAPDWQGTDFNRRTKYLMMRYAFDELDVERVEFKTDVLNLKARRALFKIGATEEGTLRSHTLMPSGRRRDTIYYSVLRSEWTTLRSTIFQDLDKDQEQAA